MIIDFKEYENKIETLREFNTAINDISDTKLPIATNVFNDLETELQRQCELLAIDMLGYGKKGIGDVENNINIIKENLISIIKWGDDYLTVEIKP